jgi:PKD repeat protein
MMRWRLATAVVLSAATLNGCTCQEPEPVLHVSPGTTVETGQTVTFDSRRLKDDPPDYTDGGTSYRWDLDGDGTFEVTGGSVQQTRYEVPGTYNVTLDEANGEWEGLFELAHLLHGYKTVPIVVTAAPGGSGGPVANSPPVASFTAGDAYAERDVNFDASSSSDSDGTVVKYEWDWEADGTYDESFTSPRTTHKYDFAGDYTVRLRVTDDDGDTGTTDKVVRVCDCIPPGKVIAREAAAGAAGAGVPFKLGLMGLKTTPGTTTVAGTRLVTAGVRASGRFRLRRAPRILGRPRSVRWAAALSFVQQGNRNEARATGKGYILLALSKRASVCLAAKASGTFSTFTGKLAVAGGRGRGARLRGTGSFAPPVAVGKQGVVKGRLKFRQVRKRRALPKSCRSLARALPLRAASG